MTQSLHVQIEKKMDYVWVTLPDALNMENYRQVEELIISRLEGRGLKVVLDCIEIQYLYSSGIGVIIRLRNHIVKNDGMLWLVNVSEKCQDSFTTMKLDKVLPVFSTDLEFELSQENIWEEQLSKKTVQFLCVRHIEDGICRVHLTGRMIASNDLSSFETVIGDEHIASYIFDCTGLQFVDSHGASKLLDTLEALHKAGSVCAAFGLNEVVKELLKLLTIDEFITICDSEKKALKAVKKKTK